MDIPANPFRTDLIDSIGDARQLLRLFDFLPDVYLYVKDPEGRFVAMSRSLAQMRDADSQDELIGKTDIDLHPIYWGNLYRQEDLRVMQSGEELIDQVWLVPTKDGSLGTFISSKIPLRDKTGRCIGIAGVMYPLIHSDAGDEFASKNPVELAVKSMNTNFHRPIEIKSLARDSGLSVSQLNRRFRARYQMSPSEYLQRIRVHQACRRLADTEDSIADVAHDTGFYDQAHLTRTFKKWRDMTPSEFRRAAQG
tara:strand:- start:286308 stop:287063 length:756 start_codon:yes stop_codon:yes gene_type:complete